MKPITLADVARDAGVAVGTASRVLNNFTDVSPDSRQRVLASVARLKYSPLRKRRSAGGGRDRDHDRPRNIGVVLLGMDDTLVHVPVLSEFLHGIESEVTRTNGNLLFANLPNADHVPPFFKGGQVDGLIVKTSQYRELPDVEANPLVKNMLRFPIVWVWARPDRAPGDLCSFNHESAARIVAEHLQGRGHRRVAFLNPKQGKSSLEHIKKEFQFACAKMGLDLTLFESTSERVASWPEPALTGPDEIFPLIDRWQVMSAERRPTAIFVPADNIAVHVCAAFERRGLRIGCDVSLMSCNNEKSLVSALKPSLTTVEVNAHRIGTRAVEQVLWRLRHPTDNSVQTILFEPTLVEGESVVPVG